VRGAERREHDGLFCSKQCHDVWHGLTSYQRLAEQRAECPKCGLLDGHRYPCV
jgi:hypothetical protein